MEIFAEISVHGILFFTILGFAALAALFSEKAGIINIAINGNMIFVATFVGVFSQAFNVPNMWMQLVLYPIGMVFGILYNLLHGFITIRLLGNQIISGIALNILAFGIAIITMNLAGESNQLKFVTEELALAQSNRHFGNIISLKLVLFLIAVVISVFMLTKTKWGLRYQAVGENPSAAEVAGINVNYYKWLAIIISGLLAGLAGTIFTHFVNNAFNGNVHGLGFLALAILIMGQWRALGVLIASFLFAMVLSVSLVLGTGVGTLQPLKPFSYIFNISPYLITLITLIFTSKNSRSPQALGISYGK